VTARLAVDGLTVVDRGGRVIVDGLDLLIAPGEVVALVGPTGAGKTTALRAVLGALPEGLVRTAGRVTWDGGDVRSPRRWRSSQVGFLGQDPSSTLHPLMNARSIVMEALRARPRAERTERAERAMAEVGLDVAEIARRLPHQLSGGQAQRVALARALVAHPELLVLDEPTSALDAGTAAVAVARLGQRRGDGRSATLIVSHDGELVAEVADHVVGLGPTVGVARRRVAPPPPAAGPTSRTARAYEAGCGPVLGVRGLTVAQPPGGRPVVGVTELAIGPGELVAVIGRSGCGKSTLLRALAGLHPVETGTATVLGEALPWPVGDRSRRARRALALVAQNPLEALNPARRVAAALLRPLRMLRGLSRSAAAAESVRLLAAVGLPPTMLRRYPGALSGGQRQRVALARALAGQPALLLADEVTAALDAEAAASVLDLLDELRYDPARQLAVLAVTHDESVALRADRVLRIADGVLHTHAAGAMPTGPTLTPGG